MGSESGTVFPGAGWLGSVRIVSECGHKEPWIWWQGVSYNGGHQSVHLDMSAVANPTSCLLHHRKRFATPFLLCSESWEVVWGGTNICTFFFQDSKFSCESLRVGGFRSPVMVFKGLGLNEMYNTALCSLVWTP